ncbi:MAG: CxxC-x17-CxxC domain-containing protein [Thermomicrobiales bacterium]
MLNQNGETDHDSQPGSSRACAACGAEYAISAAEQAFRSEHRIGSSTLCPECRSRQRAGRNAEIIAIYEKSGNTSFSAPESAAPRTSGKSNVRGQLFSTVCDACGSETRVPFVPRGDRPVYCKDCFNARRGR